jgi:hypothetical protein
MVTFDIETFPFSTGNMAPKPVCLCYHEPSSPHSLPILVGLGAMEQWFFETVVPLLQADNGLIIAHHAAYDFACIYEHIPSTRPYIWDLYSQNKVICTEIYERLTTIAEGFFYDSYALDACAKRNWDLNIDKDEDTWRLRYGELAEVPLEKWPQDAKDYVRGDVWWTYQLYLYQIARAAQTPTVFADTRSSWVLQLASCWGMETDRDQTLKMWNQCKTTMEEQIDKLMLAGLAKGKKVDTKIVLYPGFDPLPAIQINKKVQRAEVEKAYPGGNPPKTPTGKIKTDEKAIKACNSPILNDLKTYQSAQKVASTFVRHLQPTVVHGNFNAVVQSNRTSSFKPNLQNQTKLPGVRECFRARPGWVYVACDYDSQETRTLAQSLQTLLGRSSLAEKYRQNPNYDPHLEFAAKLAKITLQEAERLYKAGDPMICALRQRAKPANFGFPGGMKEKAFIEYAEGYDVFLTYPETKALRDEWLMQIPEMGDYFKNAERVSAHGKGSLVIPASGYTRGKIHYCAACNAYFQGLAAHASKAALYAVSYECYNVPNSPLYGSRIVCFVHDEIILESLEYRAPAAAQRLEQLMIEHMGYWVPDVPCTATAHLMRRWSKKAKPVYQNGVLVPWEGAA